MQSVPTVQGITTHLVAARAWERCSWPERRTCGVWPEAEQAGGPGCCATAITRFTKVPPAPLSEYQFRHPEIIAVDPALMVDPGNHVSIPKLSVFPVCRVPGCWHERERGAGEAD